MTSGQLRVGLERARGGEAQAYTAHLYHLHLGRDGRYDDALVQARRAIELYRAVGAHVDEALAVNTGGRCWAARAGRLTESLAHASRFRAMAGEMDDVRLRAYRAMEAEPYFYAGRWSDAVRVFEESLPLAWQIGELQVIQWVSAWVGLALLKLGRRDEGRQVVERALRASEAREGVTLFSLTYLTIARALSHLADGETEAGVLRARRAIALAEQSAFQLELGAAHRVLGQAFEADGQRTEAETAYRRSLEIFERIQSLPELAQTLLAFGRFRLAEDGEEGRRLVARAHAIFEEIGATGWSRETEAILAPTA